MASIDKRTDGRYRVRWREYPGSPQKTRHFDKRADAQRFLDGVRGDLARGLYIDPAGGPILFREYAKRWRVGQLHRASTAAQAETYLPVYASRGRGVARVDFLRRQVRVHRLLIAVTTAVWATQERGRARDRSPTVVSVLADHLSGWQAMTVAW